jgi:hypothetical protein
MGKKMTAPREIVDLVERFDRNREAYQSGKYNETQLRREFIDPFFKALGWDVDNTAGHAEAYKDVIHEDAIKVGSATKAPDYSFRIGGTRKFFVEAKKPSVNIAEDIGPAYQLRRYAWSAKLPLSILTDFEEFAVYDCRIKPEKDDKASTARIMYLTDRDYLARWDEIAATFSKEAVLKGSFDKYADSARLKRGTAGVDAAFLREIEIWREILARNIALRNSHLTQRELNTAVTVTINRIIFLRISEDRGIETYGQLMALKNGTNIYERLIKIYYTADDKYNSGLFHFRREKDRPVLPDTLTLNLAIDDKTLKDIFGSLYYPESPYEFSVLPADILGQVYEQFLGKIIHLTAGHRATVEDKPEVKKADGVYYTPTYIVDYIVRNTVGKLLPSSDSEGAQSSVRNRKAITPRQAAGIRILDPACGSGSFLLGAYQYLLDWHLGWYLENDPGKWLKGKSPVLHQGPGGNWRLTTAERKRILLKNIYGVDIDPQAVEVTKLSLLLKVLEGENEQTLSNQLRLFRERALPDLGNNIKCGNSLIGPDFYDNQQLGFFDDEERYRINVFDWEKEFPEITKAGGFDTVIGNPPYIRIQTLKEWAPLEVEFYKSAFAAAGKGKYDIYTVFIEKGIGLLSAKGRLGFILPHKFFNAQYGEPLRDLLAKGKHLSGVVHFGDQQVFTGATTYTCLLFLDKAGADVCRFTKVVDLESWRQMSTGTEGTIPAMEITSAEWNFTVGRGADLFEKLRRMPVKLGNVADIFVGLQTSADDVFIMNIVEENENTITLHSKAFGGDWTFEKGLLFPLVSGTDVQRYRELPERQYILFPYEVSRTTVSLIEFSRITERYPQTAAYLAANKKRLEGREKGRFKDVQWHRFGRNQNIGIQNKVKLCVPRLVNRLYAAYDPEGRHFLDNVDVGGVVWRSMYQDQGFSFLLGLLNSKLLRWYFPFVSAPFRGGWMSANRQFLSQLPIRPIDFADPADRERHERVVALVEQMLPLHKKLAVAKTDHDKTILQRQIDATDHQIDLLIYELYELTEEEIKIVERER